MIRYIVVLIVVMVLTACAQIDRFVCPEGQDRYECEWNIISGMMLSK
jgi:hypothetical protein